MENSYVPFNVLITFPSGDDLLFTSTHATRLRYKATTVPFDKNLEVVGLSHSLLIAKGLKPVDTFKLSFSVDKLVEGKKEQEKKVSVKRESPGIDQMPVSLRYYRCMTIRKTVMVPDCSCGPVHSVINEWQPRCWQDGTADQTKEEMAFYGLIYDGYKIIFVSPKLECLYMSLQDLLPPQGFLTEVAHPTEVARPIAPPKPAARKTKPLPDEDNCSDDDIFDNEMDAEAENKYSKFKAGLAKKTKMTRL